MRIGDVSRSCARAMGIRRARLFNRSRAYKVSHARQLAMTLCRLYTRRSLPLIAAHFGGFDHSTVIFGMRQVAARCHDPEFARRVSVICALIEIDESARRIQRLNSAQLPIALLPPPAPVAQAPKPKPQKAPVPPRDKTREPAPSWILSSTSRRIMVAA